MVYFGERQTSEQNIRARARLAGRTTLVSRVVLVSRELVFARSFMITLAKIRDYSQFNVMKKPDSLPVRRPGIWSQIAIAKVKIISFIACASVNLVPKVIPHLSHPDESYEELENEVIIIIIRLFIDQIGYLNVAPKFKAFQEFSYHLNVNASLQCKYNAQIILTLGDAYNNELADKVYLFFTRTFHHDYSKHFNFFENCAVKNKTPTSQDKKKKVISISRNSAGLSYHDDVACDLCPRIFSCLRSLDTGACRVLFYS